ncbi:MAG TPA: hypothetical protein DC064_26560 [Cyanobacteria bacterium UBA9273]|nr:hypothetical protein [Cyanobacteria bacterium UBA9273]
MRKPVIASLKNLAISSTLASISALIGSVVLTTQPGQATTITLEFDSLPSQQGWNYYGVPDYIPESSVFSTDGTKLLQNSMGTGLYSSGSNYYRLWGVPDPNLPFTLEVRARVLQEETNVSYENSFGFFFGATFGSDAVAIAISPNRIQLADYTPVSRTIDNRQFHTYLLRGQVGKGFDFLVDNVLIYQGDFLKGDYPSLLLFGDGTGGTNAQAELTYFRFSQAHPNSQSVPEPLSLLGIIGATSLGLLMKHNSK